MRLFFALWPSEAVRADIAAAADVLPDNCGRRVPNAKLHVTLAFIGNTDEATYNCLVAAAATVTVEPFDLNLSRFGYWPKPRLIWLGPHHMPPELLALVFKLRAVLEDCGMAADSRPYRPHITLVRKVVRQPPWPEVEPVHWPVAEFVLCHSKTTTQGPSYEVLRRWPLGSGTLVSPS